MLATVIIPTYRDGIRAVTAVKAILQQRLPAGDHLEIVVVDDGSGDDTVTLVSNLQRPDVRTISLRENQGRAAARNAGASAARGDFIIFMDCDCIPGHPQFVARHLALLKKGMIACVGHVSGPDEQFWSRYQYKASLRREHQHRTGSTFSGSSQNLAIRRDAFMAVGGFDTAYRKYGFEDRDLLIRLRQRGSIAWTPGEGVIHCDELRIQDVAKKMQEAASSTALKFSREHPSEYSVLGYSRIDSRLHPILRIAAPIGNMILPMMITATDFAINSRLPYAIKAGMAKLCTAMSFLAGTTKPISEA
ncbi:glycosyltransferase [Thermomonas brevis]|uniref:Glycosyltransferase n=1 Tax=Thermomonas brevis TaxID=215691 RepID=A0A7G9QQR4_9GAMM|nr:glycosyltransferase [Thermomonas brevis]QNN45689.1 glycosyltransferase [Thermomonas brevis]